MKSVLSPLTFLLALVLGAFAFAYATIHYGDSMRDLISVTNRLPDKLQSLGLSSQYAVWADILLGGDKLIFLMFIVIARLILALLVGFVGFVIGPGSEEDLWRERQPAPARGRNRGRSRAKPSAFDRWG